MAVSLRTLRTNALGLCLAMSSLAGVSSSVSAQTKDPDAIKSSQDSTVPPTVPQKDITPPGNTFSYCLKNIYSSIVMDSKGRILMGCNEHKQLTPASMTKLAMAYTASQYVKEGYASLDDTLVTPYNPMHYRTDRELNIVWYPKGTKITLRDALKYSLIYSAADATKVIAQKLSRDGSKDPEKNHAEFLKYMNLYTKNIGMKNSHFGNTTGGPNPPNISTAYDMAILLQAITRDCPELVKILQIDTLIHPLEGYTINNHAKIEGMPTDMIGKTGFTKMAMSTTVVNVPVNEKESLFICVFGGRSWQQRNKHVAEIFDYYKDCVIQQEPEPVRLPIGTPTPIQAKPAKFPEIKKDFQSNISDYATQRQAMIPDTQTPDLNRRRGVFGLAFGGH